MSDLCAGVTFVRVVMMALLGLKLCEGCECDMSVIYVSV